MFVISLFMSISFTIPAREKKSKAKPAVSALFRDSGNAAVERVEDPVPVPRRQEEKRAKPREERESAFLRLLRQRQMGIEPKKPVPVEGAFRDDVPVQGFGQKALREQGLGPGQELSHD